MIFAVSSIWERLCQTPSDDQQCCHPYRSLPIHDSFPQRQTLELKYQLGIDCASSEFFIIERLLRRLNELQIVQFQNE